MHRNHFFCPTCNAPEVCITPDLNRPPDFTEFVHRHAGILGRHCWLKVFFMIILSKKKEKRNRDIFSTGNYEPYARIRFKKALFSISLWCILSWLLFYYIFEFELSIKWKRLLWNSFPPHWQIYYCILDFQV